MHRRMSRLLQLTAAALVVGAVTWPAADALARAGGGSSGGFHSSGSHSSSFSHSSYRHGSSSGGSSGGGSPVIPALIGLSFFGLFGCAVASTIATGNAARKADKLDAGHQDTLHRLARRDNAWSPEHMRARVEEVFHRVQEAWSERDQDIAKRCMSPRLYALHKRQTDEMLRLGKRNVLEDVRLLDCDIIHIVDRKGTRNDEFWAVVTGSMVDYEVTDFQVERWGRPVITERPEEFKELWKFVRSPEGAWVLDKIDQDFATGVKEAQVISEEVQVS